MGLWEESIRELLDYLRTSKALSMHPLFVSIAIADLSSSDINTRNKLVQEDLEECLQSCACQPYPAKSSVYVPESRFKME